MFSNSFALTAAGATESFTRLTIDTAICPLGISGPSNASVYSRQLACLKIDGRWNTTRSSTRFT